MSAERLVNKQTMERLKDAYKYQCLLVRVRVSPWSDVVAIKGKKSISSPIIKDQGLPGTCRITGQNSQLPDPQLRNVAAGTL